MLPALAAALTGQSKSGVWEHSVSLTLEGTPVVVQHGHGNQNNL